MIARLTAVLYHRPAGCEYKGADIHIQKKTTDINKYGDFMCGNIWRYFSLGLCLAFSLTACSQSPDSNTLQVLSRVHFNTNVSNFEDSKLFYAQLGFETVSGFPDNNTLAMAHAVGISTPTSYDGAQGGAAGGYLLHGELIGLGLTGGGHRSHRIQNTAQRQSTLQHCKSSGHVTSDNVDQQYCGRLFTLKGSGCCVSEATDQPQKWGAVHHFHGS